MPGSGAPKEGGEEAWHDVDIVTTTVYTVTGYQIPKDPNVKVAEVGLYYRHTKVDSKSMAFIT